MGRITRNFLFIKLGLLLINNAYATEGYEEYKLIEVQKIDDTLIDTVKGALNAETKVVLIRVKDQRYPESKELQQTYPSTLKEQVACFEARSCWNPFLGFDIAAPKTWWEKHAEPLGAALQALPTKTLIIIDLSTPKGVEGVDGLFNQASFVAEAMLPYTHHREVFLIQQTQDPLMDSECRSLLHCLRDGVIWDKPRKDRGVSSREVEMAIFQEFQPKYPESAKKGVIALFAIQGDSFSEEKALGLDLSSIYDRNPEAIKCRQHRVQGRHIEKSQLLVVKITLGTTAIIISLFFIDYLYDYFHTGQEAV